MSKRPVPIESLAVAGAFWISIEMVVVQGASLAVFSALARLLEPEDFGAISVCYSIIYSLKALLIDQTITPIVRKEKAGDIEWTTAFWVVLLGGLSAALCLCSIPLLDRGKYLPRKLDVVAVPMSFILIAFALGKTQEAWLTRHFQFKVLAVRSIVGTLLGAFSGLLSAIEGLGVWALVVQQLVSSFASLCLLWISTPWKPALKMSRKTVVEIMAFMMGVSGNTVVGMISQNSDSALIAYFFGIKEAGVYSVAKRLRLALQLLVTHPVNGVTLPALSEAQREQAGLERFFLLGTQVILTLCAPVFIGMAFISFPSILLFFGARWSGASEVLAWLCVGALFHVMQDYFSNIILIRNRQHLLTLLSCTHFVATLMLFWLFWKMKWYIVAAPFVIPYMITLPIYGTLALKMLGLGFSRWASVAAPPIASACIMAFVLVGTQAISGTFSPVVAILYSVFIGATVYCLSITLLTRGQVLRIISFFRGRKFT